MKVTSKRVRGFLILLAVAQAINASLFIGLEKAQASFGEFIFQETAKPFLAPTPVIPHASKIEPIKNLLKK